MKNEEKTTTRFLRRGNVLDIAIVLVLLAAVVMIGYRYYQTSKTVNTEQDTVSVTFRVERIRPEVIGHLQEGDTLYLIEDGATLGTLGHYRDALADEAVLHTPATILLTDGEGNYVQTEMPDSSYVDLTGVVTCHGSWGDGDSFSLVNGVRLVPGKSLAVYTESAGFVVTVLRVEQTLS